MIRDEGLTERFIEHYCSGPFKMNAERAAIAAGVNPAEAQAVSWSFLNDTAVVMAIERRLYDKAFDADDLKKRIITEYSKIAFADTESIIANYDDIHDIPDAVRACVKKIKVTDKDGVEVEFYGKDKALADLTKFVTGAGFGGKDDDDRDGYESLLQRLGRG